MPLTVAASGITFDDLTTLSTASISAFNIAAEAITSVQLSANAVTTEKIALSAVTTDTINDGAVTTAKIALGAVITEDIADGAVTAAKLTQPLTLATAQNATGTSINFTGIPSWVNRITVIFNVVATSGSSQHIVRLGTSSGIATTGYASWWGYMTNANVVATTSSVEGFGIWSNNTLDTKSGHMTLTRISGNTWISSHAAGFTNGTANHIATGGGNATLPGTLDRIRITTINGTDTFRLGSVNIMYEG